MSRVEHWAWRLTIAMAVVIAALVNYTAVNLRVLGILVLVLAVAGMVYALLNLRWLKQQKRALEDLDEVVERWREAHGDHLSDL